MTRREFERLRQVHDRMAEYHSAGDRQSYSRLNHEIHVGLVALARNPMLIATHTSLITRARRGRHDALASKARWIEAMTEHERLMGSLADRDSRRAGEIMMQHHLKTRDALQAQIDGSGAKA